MKVILTHEHADFDAVASLVGLARLVPDAIPVLPQNVNDNVKDFLTLFGSGLPLVDRDELPRSRVRHAWLVDTRNVQSVRGMTAATNRTVIDHHVESPAGEPAQPAGQLDVQPVGATSTLIVERLASAGVIPTGVEASLLLLGIYEDTGSLTYPGTTPRDLRAAAWLLGHGADLGLRARFLRHMLSDAARDLQRRLIDSARWLETGGRHIVVTAAAAPDFDEEIAAVAGKMLELLEPDALFVLVDLGTHVQLVARGMSAAVDVGAVAEALGGGGHSRAAAAVVRSSDLESAAAAVIAHVPAAVKPGTAVAQIMARGPVRSLHPDQEVADAHVLAQRHGHEGYPVVADGVVVGLITRRDLDRAMSHHLGGEPVRRLLGGAVVTVSPDDSVEVLHQRMMAHDVGQVPVIADGRMVGIVTRTDVLRHWADRLAAGPRSRSLPNLAARLEQALSREQILAVRRLAGIASERGERAYLVGGLPRDLVLARERGPDIDLVIEGDAPAVARRAAERHGGRVIAHQRFGTAKWTVGPVAVDLISARSEYYREPTALPSVSRGTLRSDLRRRDFTINTLAVALDADRFGEVIDEFGAMDDIHAGRIRVLHGLSFVEDPTRMLRAVRFQVRLGFAIEPRTLDLVPEALELLPRVSGARIRNELHQIMREREPAGGLLALDQLGVLGALQPGLAAGTRIDRLYEALPAAWHTWWRLAARGGPCARLGPEVLLAAWLADRGAAGVRAAERLRLPKREQTSIRTAVELLTQRHVVREARAPAGALFEALRLTPPVALALAWACSPEAATRANLLRYARDLAHVKLRITGADLAALGVRPGPVYGRALRAVLRARLDGLPASREAELELATDVLRREGAWPAT